MVKWRWLMDAQGWGQMGAMIIDSADKFTAQYIWSCISFELSHWISSPYALFLGQIWWKDILISSISNCILVKLLYSLLSLTHLKTYPMLIGSHQIINMQSNENNCRYYVNLRNKHFWWLTGWLRIFDSLWPSDAIWWHRSRSALAEVMAGWLTAPGHYLNQCWLIISKVQWHSLEDIIIRRFEDTNQ